MSAGGRTLAQVGRRRGVWVVAIVVGIVVLVVVDQFGWLLVPAGDDVARYDGRRFDVVRVIDGDTIEIDVSDAVGGAAVTRVRLWGIDAPELARDDREAEPFAAEATALVSMVLDEEVVLLVERHQGRDRFGRLLAHVMMADGGSLGALLIERGLATADDRWSHRFLREYEALAWEARRNRRGIWGE